MTELIAHDRVSKALQYLIDTDESCAKAKSYYEGLKDQTSTIEGTLYLQVEGKTVADRDARVASHELIKQHQEKIQNANTDYEIMRNRRKTSELIIECWRTEQANRRRGNI